MCPHKLSWRERPLGDNSSAFFGLDRIRGDPSVHSPSILPQNIDCEARGDRRSFKSISRCDRICYDL